MGDTAINIPVECRRTEVRQLKEMVPKAVERLDAAGKDDDAAALERIHDEHITDLPDGKGTVSMPKDDWTSLVLGLDRVDDGLRPWWLTRKLSTRVQDRLRDVS